MSEQKYTVDYFIEKFEGIPDNQWYTGFFYNNRRTSFCALGHCGAGVSESSPEADALATLFEDHNLTVADVNDCDCENYPQPTPKQRVLAALRDIKAKLALIILGMIL